MTEALVPVAAADLSADAHRRAIAQAAVFARDQIEALATELRWPLFVGLAGFQLVVRLRYFRSFGRLPLDQRCRVLLA